MRNKLYRADFRDFFFTRNNLEVNKECLECFSILKNTCLARYEVEGLRTMRDYKEGKKIRKLSACATFQSTLELNKFVNDFEQLKKQQQLGFILVPTY